jgi:hypothetical protein|nr:MAG TPA: hypothetical protein [Caudoviricetes sp.]
MEKIKYGNILDDSMSDESRRGKVPHYLVIDGNTTTLLLVI